MTSLELAQSNLCSCYSSVVLTGEMRQLLTLYWYCEKKSCYATHPLYVYLRRK